MKILVTGAEGLLGSELTALLAKGDYGLCAVDRAQADVASLGEVQRLIGDERPDVVVHLAAFADVDGCETSPERAFAVNAIGARNVAQATDDVHGRMLYVSTDYVFDGVQTKPYDEFAATNPLSVYGQSKLEGEWYVRHLCRRFCIVRTSWLFGPAGRNFVGAILEKARRGEELRVVDDQVGSPTYAPHLAVALVELIQRAVCGIYHVTGQGRCSWFEFAKAIVERSGVEAPPVTPVSTAEGARPAMRPGFSVLDNRNARIEGLSPLPHWTQALNEYLQLI